MGASAFFSQKSKIPILFQQNRLVEAMRLCEQLVKINKKDPDVWSFMGAIYAQKGDIKNSESCFKRVLKLDKKNYTAYFQLGVIHLNVGKCESAIKYLTDALRIKNDFADAHNYLAYAYIGYGNEEMGINSFKKALKLDPGSSKAIVGLAKNLAQKGKFAEAHNFIEPLIEKGSDDLDAIKLFKDLSMQTDMEDAAIIFLEKKIKEANNPLTKQVYHFCLGDLYDKKQEYDVAFMNFSAGNKLSPYPSNLNVYIEKIRALKEVFTREAIQSLSEHSTSSIKPVFVVGMPRSGTSLVEQILSSHQEIYGAGELQNIGDIANELDQKSGDYPYCILSLKKNEINHYAEQYLEFIEKLSTGETYVINKMPHNFLHLGLINILFPKAKIIHCKRDSRDTSLSIYCHQFNALHSYSCFTKDLGIFYNNYEDLMVQLGDNLSAEISTINYEDLISNPENSVRQLLDFLDLPWDDACLEFYKSDRLVNTPSFAQVRKPLHNKSVGRWKNYERYLGDLFKELHTFNLSGLK